MSPVRNIAEEVKGEVNFPVHTLSISPPTGV